MAELWELADAEWARQQFEASPRDGLSFIECLGDVADISTFAGPNEQHAISAGLSRRHQPCLAGPLEQARDRGRGPVRAAARGASRAGAPARRRSRGW